MFAAAADLQKVVGRDKLRATRPVEEAVHVGQRHHAARPLHTRSQEVRQLRGASRRFMAPLPPCEEDIKHRPLPRFDLRISVQVLYPKPW